MDLLKWSEALKLKTLKSLCSVNENVGYKNHSAHK